MNYSVTVKNYLMSDIDAMALTPEAYALNPGKDFTRHRKISFKDLILLPITMEAGTMRHELYKYFNYQKDTLSNSAYCQQRNKLAPVAACQCFPVPFPEVHPDMGNQTSECAS